MEMRRSRSILDSIRRIVRALRVASRKAEARSGLSGAQLFVLQALKDRSALTITQLAQRTYTHQSSVSTVVTRLLKKKLLSRAKSKTDARRREVVITPKGVALLKRPVEVGQSRLLAGIAKLGSRDRRLLAVLLAELVAKSGFSDIPASMIFEEDKK